MSLKPDHDIDITGEVCPMTFVRLPSPLSAEDQSVARAPTAASLSLMP